MNLNERINKIRQFFITFNVDSTDGASYVLVRFPNKWDIPDRKSLKDSFKVEIGVKPEGVFFITEIENDPSCIFDAIDYVIDFNRNVEERMEIFSLKMKELKEIFATEELEKLKSLEFTFKPQKKTVGKKKGKTSTETTIETSQEVKEEITVEAATNDVEVKAEQKNVPQEAEESSLMEMAKQLTGE